MPRRLSLVAYASHSYACGLPPTSPATIGSPSRSLRVGSCTARATDKRRLPSRLKGRSPTVTTRLYSEAKRSWRWSEGPSEGIRRIRRGFPEEEPSDTANERGQAQAAPSGGAAAIRPATPRAFPSARRVSSRCWIRRAAAPWARAHARTWGARARARPS